MNKKILFHYTVVLVILFVQYLIIWVIKNYVSTSAINRYSLISLYNMLQDIYHPLYAFIKLYKYIYHNQIIIGTIGYSLIVFCIISNINFIRNQTKKTIIMLYFWNNIILGFPNVYIFGILGFLQVVVNKNSIPCKSPHYGGFLVLSKPKIIDNFTPLSIFILMNKILFHYLLSFGINISIIFYLLKTEMLTTNETFLKDFSSYVIGRLYDPFITCLLSDRWSLRFFAFNCIVLLFYNNICFIYNQNKKTITYLYIWNNIIFSPYCGYFFAFILFYAGYY